MRVYLSGLAAFMA